MKQSDVGSFLKEKQSEWMNPQLIKAISENPKLLAFFSNAEFMAAVQALQTDPKSVMENYKGNSEFTEGLNLFSNVMGNHFQSLSKNNPPPPVKPQKKISVLGNIRNLAAKDPEALEILKDPKIKIILKAMSKGQMFDFQKLHYQDPPTAVKLHALMQKGFLTSIYK